MAILWDPQAYIESGVCDAEIPNQGLSHFDFGQDGTYATGGNRWFFKCIGGPGGRHFMQHQTPQSPQAAFIRENNAFFTNQNVNAGEIWYLGYFHRIDRIDGKGVWQSPAIASGDKNFEIENNGLRWHLGLGNWDPLAAPAQDAVGRAAQYTTWVGNPTYHLNSALEINDIFPHNVSPYSSSTPVRMDYERWYACVLELKVAVDTTGWAKGYVNGQKFSEYLDIKTWSDAFGVINITGVAYGGTIAQGAYDAPPHIRKISGWIVTDELATLQARGYFSDPSITPTTLVVGKRRVLI